MTRLTELAAPESVAGRTYRRVEGKTVVHDGAGEILAGWPGPTTHVLALSRGAGVMELETVKAAVDFAFAAPTRPLRLELAGADAPGAWPGLWFAVEYAERRAEWGKRRVVVRARGAAPLPGARGERLARRGVGWIAELSCDGKPAAPKGCASLRVAAGARARDAAGWARAWKASGAASLRLDAPPAFHLAAVDALLAANGPREETAAGLLSGRRWLIPGLDLVSELYYAPDGGIFSSEEAAAALKLGALGSLRYADLAGLELARACLLAALPQLQPVCAQCVYGTRCAISPSAALAEQGVLLARTPTSAACARRLELLDGLAARLARGGAAAARLGAWVDALKSE